MNDFSLKLTGKQLLKKLAQLPSQQLFESIYQQQLWGSQDDSRFYSGDGSHDPALSLPYIRKVKELILGFDSLPVIVDLGCGDFHIGSQLLDVCAHYHACDIASNVIEHNQTLYQHSKLTFHQLDACQKHPPTGDLLIIRQVLQHLSNDNILKILRWLDDYPYILVTEHIPEGPFSANKDKANGPDSRLRFNSGVDLQQPPFNLSNKSMQIIDSIKDKGTFGGLIRTWLFKN